MKQIVCSCILIACSLLGPGNATAQSPAAGATPIDFAEFSAELADLEQCRAKHKDSTIRFSGVFPLNGSVSSSRSSPRIYLSKFGGYIVFDEASEPVFQKLQDGDRVEFLAEVSGSEKEITAHDLRLIEGFDARPPIKVSFKNFIKEFKDSPAKASEKYKNQKISFREDLYDVTVYSSGKTALVFHWGFEFVYCDLRESERQKAEKLKRGKSVSVEGHYEGGTSVRLSNCTIK